MSKLTAFLLLLLVSALVALYFYLEYRLVRFVILRNGSLKVLLFLTTSYIYIHSIIDGLQIRIKGLNLTQFDLENRLKFNPPKFTDRGFNDLHKFGSMWRMYHARFSYSASQGFRSYMEDRMHFMYDPNLNLSIFGIFDGHGGMYVSNYLESNFAVSIRDRLMKIGPKHRIRDSYHSMASLSSIDDDPVKEAIVTEIYRLDDAISMMDPKFTSLTGSTLIAAILEGNRYLTVVNVGDCRAVACDMRNKPLPLSVDHKPDHPEELRRIKLCGGFTSNEDGSHRVQGILAVSRAFGDTLLKRIGVLTAQPDVQRIDLLEKKLKFLIVGTDGFWDVISNGEAIKLANKFLNSRKRKDWHRISSYLVQVALDRRSQDNVSVLFIKLL